jgi:hypothetical protein
MIADIYPIWLPEIRPVLSEMGLHDLKAAQKHFRKRPLINLAD